jgi:hypothetical protein
MASRADFSPPVVNEADFGPAKTWLGFQADMSEVRYAPDYRDWARRPGGLETDESALHENKPTGRLMSLRQGFLAFRPIRIQRAWDYVEFALHNATPTDGVVQFRLYYGLGGPEQFWNWRHGFFYHPIRLDFTGWKAFRLERDDFTPYGGPISWLDGQLVGIGLHVSRAPTRLSEIHLANVRLTQNTLVLTAERDLLRTRRRPLVFQVTARNRLAQELRLKLWVEEESFAYSARPKPFSASLSRKSLVVPPKGQAIFHLTATCEPDAAPGDAVTYVVVAEEMGGRRARSKVRLHAVMERPGPTIQPPPTSSRLRREQGRGSSAVSLPARPPLTDAQATLDWLSTAARAYAFDGDQQAGKQLADTFRELGNPQRGYPTLCTQELYPMTARSGHEPAMECKTWYQSFFWTGPIAAARAYDLIRDSRLLSEEDKRRIEDNFLRPFGRQSTLSLNACANGQEQVLTSVLAVGLVTQDPELIRTAIDGPFGWKHAIGHDMPNGITMEGTMTYMWYVTWRMLAEAADMASYSGIDLFHMRCPVITDRNHVFEADMHQPSHNSIWQQDTAPEARYRTFMDCLRGMIAVTYPDWRFPKLNDTEDDTRLPVPSILFRNPLCREEVAALLGDTEPWTPPEYGGQFTLPQKPGSLKKPSCRLEAIGLVILRNDEGNRPEDQYLLLKYGPHGGVHGHRDKLQFVYWRHGKELAPDLPICDLEVPAWSQYYQQTASHNTIILDGQSQLPSTGERCLTFAPLQGAQVCELEAVATYAAQEARVRRLAFLTREYALILDRVVSPRPHTVDFVLHGTGKNSELTTSVPLEGRTGPLGERDGYQWITLQGEGRAEGTWEANWDIGGGVRLRLMALGTEPTRVLVGKGFEGYRRGHTPLTERPAGQSKRRLPEWEGPDETLPDAVLIARRETAPGTTRFLHLLEGHKGKPVVVSAVREGDSVRVTLAEGAREMFRWQGGDDPRQPTTCAFVREENGTLTQVALIQGQHVAEGDRVLLSCNQPVRGCSVEFRGEEAHVTALESSTIELLPPRPMRRVLVNGREVPWERVEGRIKVEVIMRN